MPAIALSDLIGQPQAVAFLRSVAASRRVSTAYLLHGPAGVGKGSAAIAFARALLCERNGGAAPDRLAAAAAEPGEPAGDACGRCAACARSAALTHPDLKFLFPVSGEERELEKSIPETLAAWREDPLFVFTYEKAASIRLSMTRELLREMAYKPFEAGRRVVVVRDADRMREDQYSALLKSIEEPGASTVWILTSSRPSRLPATIRSRCQQVRFAPLPEPLVAGFLEQRAGVAAEDARLLAALAGGSLGRALAMRDLEVKRVRDQSLALVAPALRGDAAGSWAAIQAFTKLRPGRETLRRTIEFQELWLRDLLRARHGAGPEQLAHRDLEEQIRRDAARADAGEVRRRLAALEEALLAIEGNVTPDVALFSAMARIGDRSLEDAVWPPHAGARWDY